MSHDSATKQSYRLSNVDPRALGTLFVSEFRNFRNFPPKNRRSHFPYRLPTFRPTLVIQRLIKNFVKTCAIIFTGFGQSSPFSPSKVRSQPNRRYASSSLAIKPHLGPQSPFNTFQSYLRTSTWRGLQTQDASHCLDEISEDHPAVNLDWHLDNLACAITLANNHPQRALPPWMIGDYPITLDQLTGSLMQYIAPAESGQIVGSLATHNTRVQQNCIIARLALLQSDPFVMYICGPVRCRPLEKCKFCDNEEMKNITAVALDFLQLGLPQDRGVQVFE